MQSIIAFIKDQVSLDNKDEANKLKRTVAHFILLDKVYV